MTVVPDPTRRDLAVFGLVLPVAVALAGLVVARRTGSDLPPRLVWGAGGAVAAAYLAVPRLRRPIFVGASRAAYPIGWAVSHLVLLAVFVAVITPIALLVRLIGDDPMARRPDPSAASYWTPRARRGDVQRYFQQF